MGSIIEHEMVKDTYEVTDVFIGKGVGKDYACAVPNFTVKNVRTGETVSCPSSEVNTQPFQFALEGNYTTALTKVEKPEDSAERYGETKLVEDEGVNKYSYKDNIIDILILAHLKNSILHLKMFQIIQSRWYGMKLHLSD